MPSLWTRDFLTRRIDRCYLVASWARKPERRKVYLKLARHYRRMLDSFSPRHTAEPRKPRPAVDPS